MGWARFAGCKDGPTIDYTDGPIYEYINRLLQLTITDESNALFSKVWQFISVFFDWINFFI